MNEHRTKLCLPLLCIDIFGWWLCTRITLCQVPSVLYPPLHRMIHQYSQLDHGSMYPSLVYRVPISVLLIYLKYLRRSFTVEFEVDGAVAESFDKPKGPLLDSAFSSILYILHWTLRHLVCCIYISNHVCRCRWILIFLVFEKTVEFRQEIEPL